LKEYGKSPTLDCGSGGRRGGDVCIDKIPGADFVADMTDLPFSAETFNSVFMIHSLEHVNDFHKAISEAWRVLKVDGILGVVVPTQKMSYLDPDHKHHEHPGWWEDIVELNKFELIARKNIKSEFDDKPVDFSVALVFKKVNG
jgi:ubiquinone/menaquinone biosynthesis C-methylase UbiE